MTNKILLFGGSGKLGQSLLELRRDIYAPTHKECDITVPTQVIKEIKEFEPSIVINSAALVGTLECEINRELAWKTNVDGEINIARICQERQIRHVFISSSAIFDGKRGGYTESDAPSPTFFYAVTKVAAEQAVKMLNNYAIIRLDFFGSKGLKYPKVFVDHFTSKIPAREAAWKTLQIVTSKFVGVINIGQGRKSLYTILKPYYPDIKPIYIADSTLPDFPRDISLDLSLWKKAFENKLGK